MQTPRRCTAPQSELKGVSDSARSLDTLRFVFDSHTLPPKCRNWRFNEDLKSFQITFAVSRSMTREA
jgi:hypothetical protein